jgi:hypothetical protein
MLTLLESLVYVLETGVGTLQACNLTQWRARHKELPPTVNVPEG